MNNFDLAKSYLNNIKNQVSQKSNNFWEKNCNQDYIKLLKLIEMWEILDE